LESFDGLHPVAKIAPASAASIIDLFFIVFTSVLSSFPDDKLGSLASL